MYKKYGVFLLLCNLVFFVSASCVQMLERSRFAATPVFQIQLNTINEPEMKTSRVRVLKEAASGQRIIDYHVMKRPAASCLQSDEYDILCRIVEAEAGGEDINGKILVANVILNRVESERFPDSIEAVVFQRTGGTYQFSPVRDGRFRTVKVSEETVEAVNRALEGENDSEGALYFVSRKAAAPEKMWWFDNRLTRLYKHGGHEFFS